MNDFALALDCYWHWQDRLIPMEIMRRFAETPKSALVWEGKPYGNPADVTRALLEAVKNGADAVP